MPLITIEDLNRRIYEEIVTEITREEESIAQKAIDAAIDEAKLYLSKFDLTALFGSGDDAATVESPLLQNIVIDIAVWNLIKLGNPNIQYEPTLKTYEMARKTLGEIQKGNGQPDGWPYRDTTSATAAPGNSVTYSSNSKRSNHF